DGLRSLVAKDAELSEIFMRAFILRRLELIRTGQGNVILMGSRHSANTRRLREFLTRNEHPYTYVDLDTDKTSQELLDRFEVKVEGEFTSRHTDPQTGIVTDAPVNANNTNPVPGIQISRSKPQPSVPVIWWSSKTIRLAQQRLIQLRNPALTGEPLRINCRIMFL